MTPGLDLALLLGAAVLLVAVGAVRFSTRLGVPSLLVYLALGVAIGEAGLGIRFDDVELTRVLGFCALIVIIAEGGLSARWSTLRPVLGMAAALSTVGVVVSIAVVGLVVHLALGLDWRLALLYGAVLSSTDAAAVFATLRRLRLPPRLVATLEAESGMNDAPAVIVVVLLSRSTELAHPWWFEVLLVGYELGVGAAVGVAAGITGRYALRRAALPSAGLYPIAVVGFTVLAYAAGSVLHASGFLAVYVAGVLLGNARLPHRQAILGFADGLAWLAQIGLFVLLGLLVSPGRLPAAVLPAVVTGLALLLLARPLSVAVSALPFRFPRREQLFLSWAGLRGAVPIVLATIPLSLRVPGADRLFDAVFVLVVIFTLLQAGTLAPAARRLGVTAPAEAAEVRVETAPLERMRADLLQLEVPPGSRLSGVHVDELRLPVGASVTLVLRDGAGFVPGPDTRLKVGDSLLIVATAETRDEAERRLRAVSRRGRLARWFGEYGEDRGD
ncbi:MULTISPECIES: potassium/proton antiporter [Micromonospora]|uniref:Potassium/proton antiporter n=1 Tax=Micromonospora solifontis TaxID=2487138 RepID=A0ABX9WG16_9ACTN|nr:MULTISPECIES: potassium/proton antiporter [Micromonospora]NES12247.1 potassium/proton antiporter [Micromonospora sp. PPF5-17B]NES36950.1 potassium/proton antiporter [Micromonospora solifontis]NES54270.1 potassium/proton antiporter [Micromonospora sp. PPF5-6]RNL98872.1 potassium/proton antiporter [Micromonospora solifontis]